MVDILTESTAEYLASLPLTADDLVREIEAYAAEADIPIAARSVARLQSILARATDADRALEFGTAIGYSTLHVARTGTDVVTTEVDHDRIDSALEYLRRDGLDVRLTDDPATIDPEPSGRGEVVIVAGPALETLPRLEGPFDLAFLDAVKEEYEDYLAGSLPLLPEGGLVIADNLLRGAGFVPANDPGIGEGDEASLAALRAFNETFVSHAELSAIIMPEGDGTGVGVKTG